MANSCPSNPTILILREEMFECYAREHLPPSVKWMKRCRGEIAGRHASRFPLRLHRAKFSTSESFSISTRAKSRRDFSLRVPLSHCKCCPKSATGPSRERIRRCPRTKQVSLGRLSVYLSNYLEKRRGEVSPSPSISQHNLHSCREGAIVKCKMIHSTEHPLLLLQSAKPSRSNGPTDGRGRRPAQFHVVNPNACLSAEAEFSDINYTSFYPNS